MRRPTIVDVAKHAGVSKSTVSSALRGEAGVADATAARVHASARALGYRPLRQGRASRTKVVGVAVRDIQNPHFADLVSEIEAAAEQRGARVVVTTGRPKHWAFDRQLETLLDLSVDGIVVLSGAVALAPVDAAAEHVPVVVVGRPPLEMPNVDVIVSDDERGATLAVEHLAGLGHRRIAFVTASQRPTAIARYGFYRARMREADLPVTQLHMEEGADVVREIQALGVTAAFTDNDATAFEFITSAMDRGLTVPTDLSVVGYDGVAMAARMHPRLTSIVQSRSTIAASALDLLTERFAGRTEPENVVIPPSLGTGESTAPPA